uniref:(northern house mosquito) hypothetical protein n=1 Tax=Culex pipiens TaxID=7175 RepID=A0A8D8NFN4_CULPI
MRKGVVLVHRDELLAVTCRRLHRHEVNVRGAEFFILVTHKVQIYEVVAETLLLILGVVVSEYERGVFQEVVLELNRFLVGIYCKSFYSVGVFGLPAMTLSKVIESVVKVGVSIGDGTIGQQIQLVLA